MNAQRNFEIKAAVAALTVAAAITSGLLTIRSANAAPPKKTTAKVTRTVKRKPIVVKMSGSRRAAETRAVQAYNAAIAAQNAPTVAQSAPQTGTVEAYGSAVTLPGNDGTTGTAASSSLPQNAPNNGYNPGFASPYGFGNGNYALYGPPVVNTGNGFAPLFVNGFGGSSFFAPYGNGSVNPFGYGFSAPNGFNPNNSLPNPF